MKIAFVGISHQTIVLAAFLINKKIEVSIFETDVKLIDKYKKKALFNLEPGINKILKKNYQFIKVTKDFKKLKNFTIIHFTQDINLDNKYAKDYKKIKLLLRSACKFVSSNSIFIISSQLDPGNTRNISKNFFENKIDLIGYTPNFLTIGESLKSIKLQKKIIFGYRGNLVLQNKNLIKKYFKYYDISQLIFSSLETAEIAKEAIQFNLALNIMFSNIVSSICEKYDAKYEDIKKLIISDRRFSKFGYWRPSLGFAGGHIERPLNMFQDLSNNDEKKFIKEISKYNNLRINWLIKKLNISNKKNNIKNIGFMGIAYKKNTLSILGSQTIRVISKIDKKYNIFVNDPSIILKKNEIKKNKVIQINDINNFLGNIDLLVIMNDSEFIQKIKKKEITKLKNKIIIDTHFVFNKFRPFFKKNAIKYYTIGN